ncbi:MAG: hypothetical protein AAF372_04010 [Pseudomonadota bacterium]
MDNTDFILSKFSYIFSQPLSPLSKYLKLDEVVSELAQAEELRKSDDQKTDT